MSDTTKLHQCITTSILFICTGADHWQLGFVLAAPTSSTDNLSENSWKDGCHSAVTYKQVASVVKQCESVTSPTNKFFLLQWLPGLEVQPLFLLDIFDETCVKKCTCFGSKASLMPWAWSIWSSEKHLLSQWLFTKLRSLLRYFYWINVIDWQIFHFYSRLKNV